MRARRASSRKRPAREKLALLEAGKSDKEAGVTFAKPVTVNRNQAQPELPPEALTKVFQANPTSFRRTPARPTSAAAIRSTSWSRSSTPRAGRGQARRRPGRASAASRSDASC